MLQAQALGLKGSSHPSERQLDRLNSAPKGQGTSQLSKRQPNREIGSTKRQIHGPVHGNSPRPDRLHSTQADGQTFLCEGQSRSYAGRSDRHNHANNRHFCQSEYQQLQQSTRGRLETALAADSALPSQSNLSELTAHASGGLVNVQEVAPTYSQPSVNQQLSYHDEGHSAVTLASQAHQQRWPSGNVVGPTSMGMTPLSWDDRGPKQHSSDPHKSGGEQRQVQLTRQVLSHMRGISPQRRQLLLQARLALFDSDSSSSDEEDGSLQEVS